MNKEEIEELKDFTIDITDIDELALGLEVCSKKSNMVIQEFADTIIQLQKENKQLKEMFEDTKTYTKEHLYKYNKELLEANKKLLEENKQLKEKYLNAVSDYEQEKSKNNKAIEYLEKSKLNPLDTFCKYLHIDFSTETIENIDELLEILKGEDNE